MKRLTQEQIQKIEEVINKGDRIEVIPVKDGIKIIPIEELPENFDRNYLGWIDTEENRNKIAEYCSR